MEKQLSVRKRREWKNRIITSFRNASSSTKCFLINFFQEINCGIRTKQEKKRCLDCILNFYQDYF